MLRPCHIGSRGPNKAVTFSFLVPVCAVVEDDVVAKVVVIHETDVTNPQYVDGDEDYLKEAVLLQNRRRHLLPPSGVAPLGSSVRPPVQLAQLRRFELRTVSQHGV